MSISPDAPLNEVCNAIAQRHCKRAFLDTKVPRNTIEKILLAAGNAASSKTHNLGRWWL